MFTARTAKRFGPGMGGDEVVVVVGDGISVLVLVFCENVVSV